MGRGDITNLKTHVTLMKLAHRSNSNAQHECRKKTDEECAGNNVHNVHTQLVP